MTTRVINPEAAGLSDGMNGHWQTIRRATTGNFTTLAALDAADAALAALLNSATTDLKRLREILRAERQALAAEIADREAFRAAQDGEPTPEAA